MVVAQPAVRTAEVVQRCRRFAVVGSELLLHPGECDICNINPNLAVVVMLALRAADVEPLAAALEGCEQAVLVNVSTGASARTRREQISAVIEAHETDVVVVAHSPSLVPRRLELRLQQQQK